MKFEIGQKVKWKSQAGGSTTYKKGIVVKLVPKGKGVIEGEREKYLREYSLQFDGGLRTHDSYAVAVYPEKGNAKPKLYWPHLSKLELDN